MLHVERKFLCGALALSLGTVPMMAAPFDGMWKEYNAAVRKDHPQTALEVLQRIQQKAEQQKSYGNLLQALLEERNSLGQLSEDSVKAADKRMEERLKGWQQTDGVMVVLYQTIMQSRGNAPKLDSLVASTDAGEYLKPNGATAYKPLIREGIDSRYFDNTLLAAIANHTNQWRALHEYYVAKGNRKAACIAAALWVENNGSVQLADSLIDLYQDLPECGALAVRKYGSIDYNDRRQRREWIEKALQRWPQWKENARLRNALDELTSPEIRANMNRSLLTTDTDVTLNLNVRNVKGVKVTLRRENKKAKGGYDMVRSFVKTVSLPDDYETQKDTMHLGCLPLGRWKCTVTDTEGKTEADAGEFSVSDLQVISIALPKGDVRLVVVNAITGKPVPGATLHISKGYDTDKWQHIQTDAKGEYVWHSGGSHFEVYATHADDTAMQGDTNYDRYYSVGKRSRQMRCNVYTDRAIYRPGQTVKVALAAYTVDEEMNLKASTNDSVEVILRNAQYKVVERRKVCTDAFGAASAEFVLPVDGRNGRWRIETVGRKGRYNGSMADVYVEDYRRPQFEVTLQKPETAYQSGDTITVKGTARTYSGMPVANAKVAYNVRRNRNWWCYAVMDGEQTLLNDTVTTAADGTFMVRLPMVLPKDSDARLPMYYDITATADVTDVTGETHKAMLSMPLSNRRTYLACPMAEEMLADTAVTVTVERRNMAGTEIDGRVEMVLDGVRQKDAEANRPYTFDRNIPSGEHTLMAICEGDTVKNTFVMFRKSDVRPMKYAHQWVYQSADRFAENGDSVWIQIGTSDNDVTAYYTVTANDNVIAQGTTTLSNENITRSLYYKKEYGDGLCISLAWVRDGIMYSRTLTLTRPEPSRRLKMEWVTFRDRLVPGQKEQWTVNVTTPEGMPARARVMAVLYDHALDQLRKHQWSMPNEWGISLSQPWWRMYNIHDFTLTAEQQQQYRDENGLVFTDFSYVRQFYPMPVMLMARKEKAMGMQRMMSLSVAPKLADSGVMESKSVAMNGALQEDAMEEATKEVPVRSDFAETAMFLPAVMTDAKGNATMSFTLPESVTTWRFMALTHDETMRNATLTADAVAQKELMVQPNMPRFLHSGDNATVQTKVANLSDKATDVKAVMTILDAKTEKKLLTSVQKVNVSAGESVAVTFLIDATKLAEGTYICRITAQSAGHTDGEQHYLTVLSDEEEVTKTMAYSFLEPTDTLLQFADMMPKEVQKAHLRVDYVDNPAWLMIETLPKMVEGCSRNAVSLSNALYATRVAQSMKWAEAGTDTIVSQLMKLQNSDGSFSWWEGMHGCTYMTSAVVETLVRLNWLCGRQADTKRMLDKAFSFLQQRMDEQVAWMKENERKIKPWLSSTQLSWLYSLALDGRRGGAAADYMMKFLERSTNTSDMKTKAVAAIVLDMNGRKNAARQFIESIKQHTVYRNDVGRYFDSYRAEYSWCDYRIPTQTMVIEAMGIVTPQDRKTIGEMQRWLLASKRTQEWDNAYNTVNAVHAFLAGNMASLVPDKGQKTIADGPVTRKDATVRVKKQSNSESWAAAYVTFRQKTADVEAAAMGLSVKREVLVNGVLADESNVKVGDRVQVRLTITADRDYDFVTIEDSRAACLEPVATLSGYRWGYYQEIKDTKTMFHFNEMSKGTHTVQTDYYVDRTGNYRAGTAVAACAYASEFRGTAPSYSISVKK